MQFVYVLNCGYGYYPDPWNIIYTTSSEDKAYELYRELVELNGRKKPQDKVRELELKWGIDYIHSSWDWIGLMRLDLTTMTWEEIESHER